MKKFTLSNSGLIALILCFVFSVKVAQAQIVITVGAGQTIQAAYNDSIPATISGPYVIEISSFYTPSSETYPVTLGAKAGASSSNTITIRPAAGTGSFASMSISTTDPLFLLNGATYVTLDGREGGNGSTVWTIENTGSDGYATIELENGANYNTIEYLNIYGAGGNTYTEGIVYLLCNSGGPGNNNDLIQYCNIGPFGYASAYIPFYGILGYGNGNVANTYITVQYNSIHDFWDASYLAGGLISGGVAVSGTGTTTDYGDNWTITGNSFYRTILQNNGYDQESVIYFNASPTASTATSTGNTISNNYIGGSASALAHNDSITGMYSTWEGNGVGGSVTFAGIEVFAKSANITGNVITNIQFIQDDGANTPFNGFAGIYVPQGTSGGTINIENNTIGSTDGKGKQYFSTASSAAITATTPGTYNFTVASGLDYVGGEAVMITGWYQSACGCISYMLGTVNSYSGTTLNVTTTYGFDGGTKGTYWYVGLSNGIWNMEDGFMAGIWTGANSMAGTLNIKGDTIGNLTSALQQSYCEVAGILTQNGSNTITGNYIVNLETMQTNTSVQLGNTLAINAGIAGISQQSTASGRNIVSNNIIYNLYSPITGSAANTITGIELYGGAGTTDSANANFIHSLSCPNNATGTNIYGIYMYSGTYDLINNMIRLGIRSDATSITGAVAIQGITDGESGGHAQKFYFNTVYLGGSAVAGGSVNNTYCFRRNNTSGTKDNIDARNNIFVNNRSNASGSVSHFGIGIENSTSVTSDYNDIYGTGTGFEFGQISATAYATQTLWNNASSLDANSLSADPLLASPEAATPDFTPSIASPCNAVTGATELYPTDYYGDLRADFSPVDLGAIVIPFETAVQPVGNNGLQFSVSPNPAINQLTATGNLKQQSGNGMLAILNTLGEIVYKQQIKNSTSEIIDISGLAPGIYFLKVESDKNSAVVRFVKIAGN